MKCRAIIFDLFGTLIDNFTVADHRKTVYKMASFLDAPREEFWRLWVNDFDKRCRGEFKTVEESIEYICHALGIEPISAQLSEAAKIRFSFTHKSIVPKRGAVDILKYFRSKGLKTGLISDCTIETPTVWESSPFKGLFDVCIFSCLAGIKKPDPEIYNLACDKLGILPVDCLYVGDGSSNELFGAEQAGMNPILFQDPDESDPHRIDERPWHGPKIMKLSDLKSICQEWLVLPALHGKNRLI